MEDLPNDNKEVLDAIADQNKLFDGYMSSRDKPKIKTVIPATTPEEVTTVSRDEFYEAIEGIKDNKKGIETINIENNRVSQNDEVLNLDNKEKDITENEEKLLREEYGNIIDFDKKPISEEDDTQFKKFKRDLLNEHKLKNSTSETSKKDNIVLKKEENIKTDLSDTPSQAFDSKSIENKLQEARDLPEPPSIVKKEEENTNSNDIVEKKLETEEKKPYNIENKKTYNVTVNSASQESSTTPNIEIIKKDINQNISKKDNIPAEETLNASQKTQNEKIEVDEGKFILPDRKNEVKNIVGEQQEVIKNNIREENTKNIPQNKSYEKFETYNINKVSDNKATEPEIQKPEQVKIESSVSKNLPKDEFNNQVKPLEIQNASETYLSDLSKNLQNLNNNVLNISNVLNSATNLLATIASKDFGSVNINEINARGSQQQNKQYSLINGEIDSYRQSFRTPNEINGVLGRPLAPNIPGVSYV